jgi:uncharacterized membrane protein YfcA
MRALLASPLGFLIGLSLGALGGGGSILAVPALVYAAGQDPKAATTTSLLLVGMAALVGMATHWQAGRVRVGIGIMFGLTGIGGSLVGSAVNRHIDPNVLLLMFSGLILVASHRMLVGCPSCTKAGETAALARAEQPRRGRIGVLVGAPIDVRRAIEILAAGTAVGFMTGLFGVGGGFIIVPALALVLRLPMPEAVGTSLLVIAINSAVALSTRLATTTIDWSTTAPFALAAVLGVLTGARIADRLDPKRSQRWFAVLLVAVAIYTAIRATMGPR